MEVASFSEYGLLGTGFCVINCWVRGPGVRGGGVGLDWDGFGDSLGFGQVVGVCGVKGGEFRVVGGGKP